MQEHKYEELENRATEAELAKAENADFLKKLESRSRIHREIELMKEEGKAFVLTSEEEDMLRSFRRFKLRMRRDGETFTWQTRRSEGVQLVEETAEIVHPNEV